MSDPRVSLRVAGRAYGGWKTVRVTRTIEALAGSFSLSVSERWANQDQPWPIGEGDPCEVAIGGVPVVTGYVDKRAMSFGPGEASVTLDGRDRAADLVDCSAQLGAWHFSNVGVLDLAKKIAAPYGVTVALQPGLVLPPATLPKKFAIDPGDTAAGALENLCRVAGVLAVSDGVGGIVLTRAGAGRCVTKLVQGQNIISGSATFDSSGRFRTYEVAGSHKGRDDLSGASAAGVKGTATDETARAGRVLIVRPEGNVTRAQAKTRAEWEATVRAARGDSVTVTVAGWTQGDGSIWPVNKLVHVRSARLGVNGDMLIAGVTFAHDSGGTKTQLDLRNPRAFLPTPIQKAGGGNNYWKEIVRGV